jgi:8-oxo-dGTP pyrophosphatase MutT (NUDIX family)
MIATRNYSKYSTPSIPGSCFWTHDFLLGASMVIIQPSSGKVVLVNDTELGTWFLPRGRKDVGETLEQCALREAYEEVRFLVIATYLLFKRGWRAMRACAGGRGWRGGCCTPPSLPSPYLSPFPRKEKGKRIKKV